MTEAASIAEARQSERSSSDAALREGRPIGVPIHASAVAIAGRALLIVGPSGSGKSRLAGRLIAASTRHCRIRLVGDDRILLTMGNQGLMARPHPRIAGFIERRDFGICACLFVASAPVGGIVRLGTSPTMFDVPQNFPCLSCVTSHEASAAAVLLWWRGACTTPVPKPHPPILSPAKD